MTTCHKTKWRESLMKQDDGLYEAIKRDQKQAESAAYQRALDDVITKVKTGNCVNDWVIINIVNQLKSAHAEGDGK